MSKNIIMKGVGAYIPPNKVYNDEIDEHFEQRGLSAHSLMKHLGRRKRYFISEGETAITMCSNAMDDCFEKSGLRPEDVEMLIVCTDTPEYLSPSNAIKVIGEYRDAMPNIKVAFDINANCTGMVMGVDMVRKHMMSSDIKNALVLGVFCVTPNALWDDTVVYATFADAAACVALSSVEDSSGGFKDVESIVDGSYHQYVTYPKCGMSKVALQAIQPNEKRLEWQSFDMDFLSEKWYEIIIRILDRNNLNVKDINYFIFSQLSP